MNAKWRNIESKKSQKTGQSVKIQTLKRALGKAAFGLVFKARFGGSYSDQTISVISGKIRILFFFFIFKGGTTKIRKYVA